MSIRKLITGLTLVSFMCALPMAGVGTANVHAQSRNDLDEQIADVQQQIQEYQEQLQQAQQRLERLQQQQEPGVVDISTSDDNPVSSRLTVSENNPSSLYHVFAFTLEAEDADVGVEEVVIDITTDGDGRHSIANVISSSTLQIDGETVLGSLENVRTGSRSRGELVFDDLNAQVSADSMESVSLRVSFNPQEDRYPSDLELQASVSEDNIQTVNEDTERSGEAESNVHQLRVEGEPTVSLYSSDAETERVTDTGEQERGIYEITFDVSAPDGTIYIPGGTDNNAANDQAGVIYSLTGDLPFKGSDHVADLDSEDAVVMTDNGNYVIDEAQTGTFVLRVALDNTGGDHNDFYGVQVDEIRYATEDTTDTDQYQTLDADLSAFETDEVSLAGGGDTDTGVSITGWDASTQLDVGQEGNFYMSTDGADRADLVYAINWGDGTSDTQQADPSFTHTYDEPGTYTVRGMVRTQNGRTASSTHEVEVEGEEIQSASEEAAQTVATRADVSCSSTSYQSPVSSEASTEYSSRWSAENAIDGTTETAWYGAQTGYPKTLTVDLGSQTCVNGVRLYTAQSGGYLPQTMDIQVSRDGAQWRTVISDWEVQNTYGVVERFSDTNARYMRVVVRDSARNYGTMADIEVRAEGQIQASRFSPFDGKMWRTAVAQMATGLGGMERIVASSF